MKHLFVIRHGDYNREDGDLSSYGVSQIEKIAKEMKSIVGEEYMGHQIISSFTTRAQRSAQIIAENFKLNSFDKKSELLPRFGEDLTYEELKRLDNLIEPYKENDIVTLTTHYEVLNSYPVYLVEQLFGKKVFIPPARKGEGVHLDLENKIYRMIPKEMF